jgi:hypothetical protein
VRTQSIAVSPPPITTTFLPRGVQAAVRMGGTVVAKALAVGRGEIVERLHDARRPTPGALMSRAL